jgi:hypothetical protein
LEWRGIGLGIEAKNENTQQFKNMLGILLGVEIGH